MSAVLLDGVAAAKRLYLALESRVADLKARDVVPGLATVVVGDNPASAVYVRNKVRACRALGIHSHELRLDGQCSEQELINIVGELNSNPAIHGIIVQLPLPRHLSTDTIVQAIAPHKDVDGFNWGNLGALLAEKPVFVPCTPLGILHLLDEAGIPIAGRHAVVVGRGSTVGRPLALMLIARGATVTVCNSKTRNLAFFTSHADILVAATGRPGLITAEMVGAGAAVIDVGIARLPEGGLVGDVDFAAVREAVSFITPVPGGVGPMTVAMLVANTVTAAERTAAASG